MLALRDEVLLQLRLSSNDLDGYTLAEMAQLLIALLEITLIALHAAAIVALTAAGVVRAVRALPSLPAAWLLGRVRWWMATG